LRPGRTAETDTTGLEHPFNIGFPPQSQHPSRLCQQREVERACKIPQLDREHWAALRSTRFADLTPLVAAGVDWRAITEAVPAFTAIAKVTDPTGFEYDPEGADAFLLPVRADDPMTPESTDPHLTVSEGAIVDLLAFHPLHPNYWRLRRGTAEWLGAIEPQHFDPDPVPLWRSPLRWLQAGCVGLVLLGDRPSRYRHLMLLRRIVAEDAQHGADIESELARPSPVPQVILSQESRRAA
jgi:hypothetical protein